MQQGLDRALLSSPTGALRAARIESGTEVGVSRDRASTGSYVRGVGVVRGGPRRAITTSPKRSRVHHKRRRRSDRARTTRYDLDGMGPTAAAARTHRCPLPLPSRPGSNAASGVRSPTAQRCPKGVGEPALPVDSPRSVMRGDGLGIDRAGAGCPFGHGGRCGPSWPTSGTGQLGLGARDCRSSPDESPARRHARSEPFLAAGERANPSAPAVTEFDATSTIR